ncbi:MAG: cytochrome b [Glaciimonas sp.]|nr:cytochrome b [Glaciimonas sp.]
MLLLLIAVYACMDLRDIFPEDSTLYNGIKTWHYMLGLSVFGLVFIRLAARLLTATPAIKPTLPKWQARFSFWMHVALYLLMIVMPLLGWLILSAAGKPIPFFGLELPALIAKNKANATQIKDIHETIATVGYFLIGLHAAAGLFHHYWVGDNTLKRMLPFRT